MVLERGPQGKLHLPAHKAGCYYQRTDDCCLLCLVRLSVGAPSSLISYRVRNAQTKSDHELVGEEVIVPRVTQSDTGTDLEYVEGRVANVHMVSGADPDILTVYLTEVEEHVHIDLTGVHIDLAGGESPG